MKHTSFTLALALGSAIGLAGCSDRDVQERADQIRDQANAQAEALRDRAEKSADALEERADNRADRLEDQAANRENEVDRQAELRRQEAGKALGTTGNVSSNGSSESEAARDEAEKARATVDERARNVGSAADERARIAENEANRRMSGDENAAVSTDINSKHRAGMLSPSDIKMAQEELKDQGLYEGAVDGIAGKRTLSAIRQYQKKENLTVTSRLDAATLKHLRDAS